MPLLVRDKSFYRTLVRLAIPISLQNFITFGVSFADNLMVGTLGENTIAGVYMANQLQTLLQFYVTGIDAALLILAAQYWGRRDTDSIKRLTAIALRLSMAGGIVLSAAAMLFPDRMVGIFSPDPAVVAEGAGYLRIAAFSYIFFCVSQILVSAMRGVENVRIGLGVSIAALVSSVSLNYVLIFGKLGFPAMGARGAALATVISRAAECTVMLCYVLLADKKLGMKLRDFFARSRALFRDFIKYGMPVLGGNIVWAVNILAQSWIIGRMGAEAVASVSITGMLNNLVFVWIMGLGSGVGVITGKTVGAGDFDTMKLYAKTVQIIFTVIGFVCGASILLLKEPFLSLYAISGETAATAGQFMTVLSVTSIGRSYQATCLAGLVKAGGDTGFVFKNDTIFVFAQVLPSALIAMYVFNAPAWVVYACLQSDQVLKCFVAVVKINRFKWMKNLTRAPASEV